MSTQEPLNPLGMNESNLGLFANNNPESRNTCREMKATPRPGSTQNRGRAASGKKTARAQGVLRPTIPQLGRGEGMNHRGRGHLSLYILQQRNIRTFPLPLWFIYVILETENSFLLLIQSNTNLLQKVQILQTYNRVKESFTYPPPSPQQ